MRKCFVWLLEVALLCGPQCAMAQIVINELMPANDSTIEDPDEPGAYEDWVEIYNVGAQPMDLGGALLSDDPATPDKWAFPEELVLAAQERVLVWLDNDPEQGPLHASFRLGSGGEELALYGADGVLIDQVTFGPTGTDQSFGRFPDGAGDFLVMAPTPGTANVAGQAGVVTFSRASGLFRGVVQVALSTDTPGASIYYTLDRREPSAATSELYAGPLTLATSGWLRARAYAAGLEPGPVGSRSYIGIEEDLADFDSNLPLVFIDSFGVNIDGRSSPGVGSRPYRQISLVMFDNDPETGRTAPTGAPDFAGHAGLRVRGQSTSSYPKKSYNLEIWDEDDEDRDASLLGLPSESDWVLHGPYSDKTFMRNALMFRWWNRLGRWASRTRYVEAFVNFRAGERVSRNDYRGVYLLMERIKRDENRIDIAKLDPGDEGEPAVTGGYILRRDWTDRPQNELIRTTTYRDTLILDTPKPEDITAEQSAWITQYLNDMEKALASTGFSDPELGYERFLDVDSFIEYAFMMEISRNVDAYVLSAFLTKDRGGKLAMGPIWDFNGSLGGANYFCSCQIDGWHYDFDERDCPDCREGGATFPVDNTFGYRWYERLQEDPVYNRRFAARWGELRAAPLSNEAINADISELLAVLTDGGAEDNPARRNFERWDILDRFVWPNFFVGGTYRDQVDFMQDWIIKRVTWMDSALTVPPEVSHPGGDVSAGLEVTLSVPEGEIYYTLNDTDPRAEDGAVAATALLYDGTPIPITGNTRLRVRARIGDGVWSDLVETVYVTETVPLVVTEIMFDPPELPGDTQVSTSRYEYLEFKNIGDQLLNLRGFQLLRRSGSLRFDFAETLVEALEPGQHVVVVNESEPFRERYGDVPLVAGEYSGTLGNSQDTIIVRGPLGEAVQEFVYQGDWYPESREGHAIVIRDPSGPRDLWSAAKGWRPSVEIAGSPGADDVAAATGRRLPGDLTGDEKVNVGDAIEWIRMTHFGAEQPCDETEGSHALLDVNADAARDLSDVVYLLRFVFRRGPAPALGTECRPLRGCPEACADS